MSKLRTHSRSSSQQHQERSWKEHGKMKIIIIIIKLRTLESFMTVTVVSGSVPEVVSAAASLSHVTQEEDMDMDMDER